MFNTLTPKNFSSTKINVNWLILIVFLLAIALRIQLALINTYANDDHMAVINIIKNEARIPVAKDCRECFGAKLYHVFTAIMLKTLPLKNPKYETILAQLINCVAGAFTLLIIWLFLRKLEIIDWLKFICFSLVAFNPGLVGINIQATNDSFVILFATATIYFVHSVFKYNQTKNFIWVILFAILAGISKGNGLVLFFGITLTFILKAMVEKASPSSPFKYSQKLPIFILLYLLIVPIAGQYFYNYSECGAKYAKDNLGPTPHFFKKTDWARPGVTSVFSSFFTFRIVDLIKNPTIGNNDNSKYSLHRTSLWSQLYGRTHFIFFDMWPPEWQTNDPRILNTGRVIFILALFPTFIVVFGFLKRTFIWITNLIQMNLSFLKNDADWVLDIFLLGYILFIICFVYLFRDFSYMKAIFIFPALLPIINLLAKQLNKVYQSFKKWEMLMDFGLITLISLYFFNGVFLYFKLILNHSGALIHA